MAITIDLNEQERGRRESLAKLRELGINPYPAPLYPVNTTTVEIAEGYRPEEGNFSDVCIAGRIMSRRIMGAASFMELQDPAGRIQVYVKRDEICPGEDKTMYNSVFKKLLDIGDIVGIKGFAFITQTGQLSIHAKELTVLSKSLRVLPIVKTDADGTVHDGFADPELRYRQRYVDLVVNPRRRSSPRCAATSTRPAAWRWKPRSCSPSRAARPHVRSSRTTMRWMWTCISASRTNCT